MKFHIKTYISTEKYIIPIDNPKWRLPIKLDHMIVLSDVIYDIIFMKLVGFISIYFIKNIDLKVDTQHALIHNFVRGRSGSAIRKGGGVQTMKSLRVKFRISNNDFIMHEHFLSNLYLHII